MAQELSRQEQNRLNDGVNIGRLYWRLLQMK